MVEIPKPPALELSEDEQRVIQINRDYQRACEDESAALHAAVEACFTYYMAYAERQRKAAGRAQMMGLPLPKEYHSAMNQLRAGTHWGEDEVWGRLIAGHRLALHEHEKKRALDQMPVAFANLPPWSPPNEQQPWGKGSEA